MDAGILEAASLEAEQEAIAEYNGLNIEADFAIECSSECTSCDLVDDKCSIHYEDWYSWV